MNATTRVRSDERRLEHRRVEGAVTFVEVDHPYDEIEILRELQPRRDVAVVVEAGHHDLVARAQVTSHGSRQREVERRHVCSEADLLR